MRSLMVLLLAGMALPAAAQLVESIEVRVTNVEVVVTDRAGKPLHGLTRDDFELFEDGKRQPITNFYEVRAAAGSTETAASDDAVVDEELRKRRIIVFIDNTSIEPFRRNEMLKAVASALDTLLRPGDDAMIVAWERRLKVLQPFTDDPSHIRQVIQTAAKTTAGAANLSADRQRVLEAARHLLSLAQQRRPPITVQEAYRQSLSLARAYGESVHMNTRGVLVGLKQMIATLGGLDGRKVLLMVGGELQERAGVETIEAVNGVFRNVLGVATVSGLTTDLDRSVAPEIQKVVTAAAGSGVALYLIDVADRSPQAEDLGDTFAEFLRNSGTWLTMGQLADATGGRAFSGSTNYRALLDGLARDLSSYYSLGYRATASEGMRSVKVNVLRPGLAVRTRRAVVHKSAHSLMQDRVVTNAFHRRLEGDFPVTIRTAPAQPDGRNFKVDLTVVFPGSLTYLPDGDSMVGEFGVYLVVASADGNVSPVSSEIRPVRFPAKDSAVVDQTPFEYATTILVRPGKQTVSVAIVDNVGERSGFATAEITAAK